MADKQLTSNVFVDGAWYGPDYPDAKVTADVLSQIDNPAAFAPRATGIDLNDRGGLVDDEKPRR